jgi:hypothetical protein
VAAFPPLSVVVESWAGSNRSLGLSGQVRETRGWGLVRVVGHLRPYFGWANLGVK